MGKIKDLFVKQKKSKIASEQLGECLWLLIAELTSDWKHSFYKNGIPRFEDFPALTDEKRQVVLQREMFIINNWIISHVLGSNRRVLDYLHKFHLDFYNSMGKTDQEKRELSVLIRKTINKRYEQYDEGSDSAHKSPALSAVMLQNMLGKEEPVSSPSLMTFIAGYVVSIKKNVTDFCNRYEIVDN